LGCEKLCYALQDYLDSVRREYDAAEERAIDPRYQGNDDERARKVMDGED
jgi:GTP-binding protein